jgi:hypothetical protein
MNQTQSIQNPASFEQDQDAGFVARGHRPIEVTQACTFGKGGDCCDCPKCMKNFDPLPGDQLINQPSKQVALRCWSSNDQYNADFDYALVTVTPALVALAEKRHAQFDVIDDGHSTCARIHYYDCTPEYFSEADLSSWMEDFADDAPADLGATSLIDGGECEFLPSGFNPRDGDESGDFRSECDHMVVTRDGVAWECTPKHSSITISTAYIGWKDLAQMLTAEEVAS